MKGATVAIIGALFLVARQRTQPEASADPASGNSIRVVREEQEFGKFVVNDPLFDLLSLSPLQQSTPFARQFLKNVESDDPRVWVEKVGFLLSHTPLVAD